MPSNMTVENLTVKNEQNFWHGGRYPDAWIVEGKGNDHVPPGWCSSRRSRQGHDISTKRVDKVCTVENAFIEHACTLCELEKIVTVQVERMG